MTWINLRGIAFAAFIQGLITLGFVSVGLCFLLARLVRGFDTTTSAPMNGQECSVLVMVPALLVGFDVIPQSAEEINLPARRIGLLLVISVALAGLWYVAITVAVGVSCQRRNWKVRVWRLLMRWPQCGAPRLGADHADRRVHVFEQLERFYYWRQSEFTRSPTGHDPKGLRFDASSVPNAACRHTEYRRSVLFRAFVWSGNFSLARECGQFRYCHCLPLCCRVFQSFFA